MKITKTAFQILESGHFQKRVTVSIIIVNYNGERIIGRCLESLRGSESEKAETLVVDNASNDRSYDFISRGFPEVKFVSLERNFGFSTANNIGAEAARGEYLVFLNSDTVVTPGWLGPLLEVLRLDPATGVVGSKLMLADRPGRVNSAGVGILWNGGGYDIGFMDLDSEKYNMPGPRGGVCAAAMMVRKEEFLSLGGFDPSYFMYFEDVDLCWRYWLSGFRVLYVPASVVYHLYGGSSGADRHGAFRVFYGTRNALMNGFKNLEARNIPVFLCLNLAHHTLKFLGFLLSFRIRKATSIVRGYGSFVKHLPQLLRKRRDIQGRRRISDRYLVRNALLTGFRASAREYYRLWCLGKGPRVLS
jgi:hypothetical protein